MEEKVFFRNNKGQKLAGIISKPDREGQFPAVVYVHGFGGRAKDSPKLIHVAKALVNAGFVFFRFDFNGVNESEGNFFDATISGYVNDLQCAVEFIEKQSYVDGSNISLYCSSLGVLVSVAYYPKNGNIRSLVFVSGESKFSWHKRYLSERELHEFKARGYYMRRSDTTGKVQKLGYNFVEDGLEYDFNRLFSTITCPVLVVQGDKDTCVPYENMSEILNLLRTEKESVMIEGADHWFTNEETQIFIKSMVKFLKEHVIS